MIMSVDKLFLRVNNHDYLVMDYTLNEGSSFSQSTFNTHQLRTVTVRAPGILSVFDSLYHSKGYWYSQMYYGAGYYHSENLGETRNDFYYGGPGNYYEHCIYKMIRAILYDSTGVKYYSDHVKPIINFQPVLITNEFELNWNFSVDHEYTYFESNGSENFVDSVIMYSYYSNEDSTFTNASSCSREYSQFNQLLDLLFT